MGIARSSNYDLGCVIEQPNLSIAKRYSPNSSHTYIVVINVEVDVNNDL